MALSHILEFINLLFLIGSGKGNQRYFKRGPVCGKSLLVDLLQDSIRNLEVYCFF